MVDIPPLPVRTKTGKCPWCQAQILQAVYQEMPHNDVLALEDGGECPKCHKPIRAHFEECITYETKIMAERTATDKRYLAHMGISE